MMIMDRRVEPVDYLLKNYWELLLRRIPRHMQMQMPFAKPCIASRGLCA